jgi:hypothetical protein
MRVELADLEGQVVVVRGVLKQVSHLQQEGPYNLLFVNCVVKPVGETTVPLADVPARRTDHAWVQVPEPLLEQWRMENPTSLLLKKYENAFTVRRYRRLDGTEDYGFCLPDQEWLLVSRLFTALNYVKATCKGKPHEVTLRLLEAFREQWSGRNMFTSVDSKVSIHAALTAWAKKYMDYYDMVYLRLMAGERPKKKKQQKQGPKPGKGF